MSCGSFADVPYSLFCSCIEHPHLTIYSEKQFSDALLVWLASNGESLEHSSSNSGDDYYDFLKKVRIFLLPLGYAAGKRRSHYYSKLADESISAIFRLIKDSSMSLLRALNNDEFDNIRIRLTQYSETVDLSGCPQITAALLLLSVLPLSCNMDAAFEKIRHSLLDLENLSGDQFPNPQKSFPTVSFEAVRELNISKCPRLHLHAVIKILHISFPSLRILKAFHCLHFKTITLFFLVQKCPLISEVDLTVDISPVIPAQVSIISTSTEGCEELDNALYEMTKGSFLSSNITKLTFEGRTDINDLDLLNISELTGSLSYLNLKGCTSVTDLGISKLLCKCMNLCSIIVSETYFGRNSILALCSDSPFLSGLAHHDQKYSATLAFRLQLLDIGGCKSVNLPSMFQLMTHTYFLKSLSVRETVIVDDALCDFMGSSLESLDISETMVSGNALAYIIRRNPGLKVLKARSCRNLGIHKSNTKSGEFPPKVLSHPCESDIEGLCCELTTSCILEELAFGWGFSPFSLEKLRPTIRSLKALTVGLGASLGHHALGILPMICPMLESVILNFQVISDSIVRSFLKSLRNLKVLGLCWCFGDLTSLSFQTSMLNLRTLRLERVTPWLTNGDLLNLTQNCSSLCELTLSGCTLLDSDSQEIISSGWPGLTFIHLEDCGKVTSNGVSSLLDCKALEDISLRHNGQGIPRSFIADAASKLPLLRKVALDLCDASEGGFNSPNNADRFFVSIVKIACCKSQRCAFELPKSEAYKRSVHKETIVLEWNSKELRTTVVKDRL